MSLGGSDILADRLTANERKVISLNMMCNVTSVVFSVSAVVAYPATVSNGDISTLCCLSQRETS